MVKPVSSSSSLIPSTRFVPSHRLTTLFGIVIAAGLALTVGAALYIYFYRRKKVQPVAPTSLQIAKECYARGDYKNALAHCKDARIGDPREILLLQAQAHFALRQNNDAMRACQSLARQPLADQPLLAAETYLLLGNIYQRDHNFEFLDSALQQYDIAWKYLSCHKLNVPVGLKVEILMGRSLALVKSVRTNADATASRDLTSAEQIIEEFNKANPKKKDFKLEAKVHYYRIYYYMLTSTSHRALIHIAAVLEQLQHPSNDQELNLKAEVLLLKSLIHEKKGDRKDATAAVQEVFNLDPFQTILDPQPKVKEIEVVDKEIVAAAYFLRARYTESPEEKIDAFTKAFAYIENDDFLKTLIQCERGHAHLKKACSSNDAESYQKAREDFNISIINTFLRHQFMARHDLWRAIIEVGELKDRQQRIKEGREALPKQSSSAV